MLCLAFCFWQTTPYDCFFLHNLVHTQLWILVAKSKTALFLKLHMFIPSMNMDFVTRIGSGHQPFPVCIDLLLP